MRGIGLVLLLAAAEAAAHGGGMFPDPPPRGVPPGLRDPGPPAGFRDPQAPCACVAGCRLCTDGERRIVDRRATRHWNDFTAVRIDLRGVGSETAPWQPPSAPPLPREEPPPQPEEPARPALFVETESSTEYGPVRGRVTTVRGVLLVKPAARGGIRLYRCGRRFLVVRDLEPGEVDPRADFVDGTYRRSLTFLDIEEARLRDPAGVRGARSFAALPAVEAFLKRR
jgi:hypothetical protein